MESIDAIYLLCHPEKEPSRWERLIKHLDERGLPQEKYFQVAPTWSDTLNHKVFDLYDPFCPRACPYLSWKGRSLTLGEISLVFNFWSAVDHALERGFQYVVFFESDVFLRDDFMTRFGEMWDLLQKTEWDYVSLSDGVGSHAKDYTSVYQRTSVQDPPHIFPFRCTDSMVFRVSILAKMRPRAFPFRECLDWELNYQLGSIGGKALWVEPHLVEQGTCKNRMPTSLPS